MIQELVRHCSTCYDLEVGKAPFTNDHCISCVDCLKEIHFNHNSDRKYDCPAMCHYYVCQNIYRYASEMVWLFHDSLLGLRQRKDSLKICSIGCGPCSELVAFEEYHKRYQLSFEFTYEGFDTNKIWEPVQKYVKSIASNPNNITFHDIDVFDYYEQSDTKPNLIILNYVLSDMLNHDKEEFVSFLSGLEEFVKGLPSCAILINDINLGVNDSQPRKYYSDIYKMTFKHTQPGKFVARGGHFKDSKKNYFQYGIERPHSNMLFDIPDEISSKFVTNTECHSAQLLIIKKK